jgi:hypothetical protein
MNIKIYIQSSIFNTEFRHTQLFENNQHNLFALDTATNALAIENISDETILALIAEHVKEVEPQNYSEELLPFNGGVYLQAVEKYIDSNCCGDISNIDNWREILVSNNTHWQTLWIGHPEIAYKFDETFIYLSEYLENAKDIEVKFQFDRLEFCKLLAEKIKLFDAFKSKVYEVLDSCSKENYGALKKVLF